MRNPFEEWKNEIEAYCIDNNLSFEKAEKMSKSWSKNDLVLQYFNPESESVNKGLGLLDETPMPVVLWITKNGDSLCFEQTEYTQKYLSVDY